MIINMILNENGEFETPHVVFREQSTFKVALVSFRCTFREPINETKFLCLRTNLVDENALNPYQIIGFFTVNKRVKHFTFNMPNKQPYKLHHHNLAEGVFQVYEVNQWEDEIALEKSALQIYIEHKDE